MGILSAIVGAISAVVSAISVVVAPILALPLQEIALVAGAILAIGKALGIIKPEEKPEELGDKALQAADKNIKPENFESYSDYVKEVEKFKCDPEKSKKYTTEEKLRKATELSTGIAIENLGKDVTRTIVDAASGNPEYWTPGKMTTVTEQLKTGKMKEDDIKDIAEYIHGTTNDEAGMDRAIGTLKGIEKMAAPEISDDQAESNALHAMKE